MPSQSVSARPPAEAATTPLQRHGPPGSTAADGAAKGTGDVFLRGSASCFSNLRRMGKDRRRHFRQKSRVKGALMARHHEGANAAKPKISDRLLAEEFRQRLVDRQRRERIGAVKHAIVPADAEKLHREGLETPG